MSVAETFNPSNINLSDRAVQKVRDLVEEEDNDELKLRVFITGGGCSGFQYGFTFDELAADDDTAIEKDGVTVLVDPMSFQYLAGSEVEALLVQGVIPLDGEPRVAFVLHGPEVYILLRQNYLANKAVVDRAASLSALGVVEIKACETWMGSKGIDPDELQPFVATIPYGPAEEQRLVKRENYIRF